ncbi:polyhydroxyalkanoate synthesis repressor PhaR [Thalassobaculum fulvum]|jgi:polyhydroxyalkanoate synthesis repressor PhaR|uniref:Polyhydroxyalkanoate synthesis repressor PhaR n=1 Tax=Thalassobaculum fulvum TaxID=1633335 RepID=A0A919CNC0_9PROT|nr:polyhydroxyalkanoate synthesis repressor PhaR [Thalassobaculum fulvum]GHD41251.1 polyhydroxyalkanoate synthesis repressor PhaR [Thalassobaculum fulvum]
MAEKTRATRAQNGKTEGDENIVTIKKYANRRLYNTATSSYVTLDHLCQMVKDDVDFVVYDAKTGEDITRAVLTQIIVEEEAKGQNLLPISFLRQLIGFYGDNLQMVVPRYLETAMSTFADNQERMRSYMQEAFGGLFPFTQFEDMTKKNLAMFEQAMKMFTPPMAGGENKPTAPSQPSSGPASGAAQGTGGASAADQTAAAVRTLQAQVEQLRHQLDRLGEDKDKG